MGASGSHKQKEQEAEEEARRVAEALAQKRAESLARTAEADKRAKDAKEANDQAIAEALALSSPAPATSAPEATTSSAHHPHHHHHSHGEDSASASASASCEGGESTSHHKEKSKSTSRHRHGEGEGERAGAELVDPDEWFAYLAGRDEAGLRAAMEECSAEGGGAGVCPLRLVDVNGKPNVELTNLKSGKKWNAGRLRIVTIKQLLDEVEAMPDPTTPANPTFIIVTRSDQDSEAEVDVAALQAVPKNKNSTFLVASNFNALEAISETSYPSNPHFTEYYVYDKTQGPAASIGAGAAAIARVYAAFIDDHSPPVQWKQTETRQINLLGHPDLAQHFPIVNGYVVYDSTNKPEAEEEFPAEGTPEYRSLLENYCVALHENVQATFGSSGSSLPVVDDPTQVIDQVFCAAVNMAQGANGQANRKSPNAEAKAKFILEACFTGMYLSAILNGRAQIFPCLIGSGAFGNSPDWVWTALYRAHRKYSRHRKSTLQSVVLPIYQCNPSVHGYVADLRKSCDPYLVVNFARGVPENTDSSSSH
ncbi:hypothetical protein Pelo_6939 [Pelomyxa schiedti]|nr:hypothetical protein Pelo_6939 [Pelomyxa schiedti]